MRRGATPLPRRTVGAYYTTPGLPSSTASPTLNRLRLVPFDNDRASKFDRIASEVTGLGAGATLRWVVYSDNGRGYPGALVLDTGAVGDASTTGVKEATVSLTLAARRYWVGCIVQGTDSTLRVHSGATAEALGSPLSSLGGTTGALGHFSSNITGAAPGAFPADAPATSQAPMVWLRKS